MLTDCVSGIQMGHVAAPVSGASAGKTHDWARCECLGTGILWRVLHSHVWRLGCDDLKVGLSWDCWLNHIYVVSMWLGLLPSGQLNSKRGCLSFFDLILAVVHCHLHCILFYNESKDSPDPRGGKLGSVSWWNCGRVTRRRASGMGDNTVTIL